jgi:uncharacterized membrane protein
MTQATQSPSISKDDPQRRLEMFLHNLLVGGVILSSALLILGLVTALAGGNGLPDSVPPLSQVIPLALSFDPTGLLALGFLVLIATPILRVAGSVIGFMVERDWRYALLTFVVFLIVLGSILAGKE